MSRLSFAAAAVLCCLFAHAEDSSRAVLLRPAQVWTAEGAQVHGGWVVLVQGHRIVTAGPEKAVQAPADAQVIDLPGTTVLPGLMDLHSHLFLSVVPACCWGGGTL